MKKINILVLTLLCILASIISAKDSKAASNEISIFNWGEYIDDSMDDADLISAFEKEFNCKVNYAIFDSNEMAITKMATESYDIVIPSDYAIEQLVQEDLLLELDWSKIEGFSKEMVNSDLLLMLDELKEEGFDLLKYAVPYFCGNVGILYNKETVAMEDLENEGWAIFKNDNYTVGYYDSSRDGFMPALKDLGYSMNTTNVDEINEAREWLLDMKNSSNPSFRTDELLSEMPRLKYDLALIYSGDGMYCMDLLSENYDEELLGFYVPESGTNVWCDGMVIPKNAKNVDLAYKFMSFMSREENAYANSLYVGYTSANGNAYEAMLAEDGDYYCYYDYYKITINENDEIYRYNKETKVIFGNEWSKVKVGNSNYTYVYIVIVSVIALIAGYSVYKKYRNKKFYN